MIVGVSKPGWDTRLAWSKTPENMGDGAASKQLPSIGRMPMLNLETLAGMKINIKLNRADNSDEIKLLSPSDAIKKL